jgi:hypothetical protein
MDISDIKRSVTETIERAKRRAGERRARADEAGRAYERLLDTIAVPLFRQVANVLRADGYLFSLFTPSGSVRLMSDRHAEDFIELLLDTSGDRPMVVGHVSHGRGRRVDEANRDLGDPAAISEEDLLAFLLKELEPFVEK